ncbi:hypothetical protein HAX54_001587 [Datura stramonium]|uniref:Uncharacterized protein n=1 Tax=Datura stramonium TaxID=4076 RepID=A0ABS8T389_DATST|nr:hypothetical protein [Datura stramonium]
MQEANSTQNDQLSVNNVTRTKSREVDSSSPSEEKVMESFSSNLPSEIKNLPPTQLEVDLNMDDDISYSSQTIVDNTDDEQEGINIDVFSPILETLHSQEDNYQNHLQEFEFELIEYEVMGDNEFTRGNRDC